jgi:tRNA-Thr(GGU) m(6)t(6)A37 methyltransferase TsaA
MILKLESMGEKLSSLEKISIIETPFHEKFGVPRQSLLIEEAWGVMCFPKNDFFMEAFRGIEESSHLWLIFEFHQVTGPFNGLVRPPRFENKKKMGVYATRSPHRPNRLGLSLVKFEKLEVLDDIKLWVSGVDLVSGTPIFDIKPYLPYADHITAQTPFEMPKTLPVTWQCEAPKEKVLIEKVIALDPRPSFDKASSEEFGVSIAGLNVRFKFLLDHFEVIEVTALK